MSNGDDSFIIQRTVTINKLRLRKQVKFIDLNQQHIPWDMGVKAHACGQVAYPEIHLVDVCLFAFFAGSIESVIRRWNYMSANEQIHLTFSCCDF